MSLFEETIINYNEAIFHITTPKRQKYYINNKNIYNNNISSTHLNECEDILKKEYNINSLLIIMKIDLKRNDTPSTQVEYQVINSDNNEILDLSILIIFLT